MLSFAAAFNCSRSSRTSLELLHISKAGGTSVCQLAVDAGLRIQAPDMDRNCMVGHFGDGPRWARFKPSATEVMRVAR